MRAPRALIPLLAVCGAAAVVITAGAGAAIEQGPGSASVPPPAFADAAVGLAPVSINTMTWNVCGGSGCPADGRQGGPAGAIARQMADGTVGGRAVEMEAVLLQEVCAGQVKALGRDGWTWLFAPTERSCSGGDTMGVAVGARTPLDRVEAPDGAVCGDAAAWRARLCSVQTGPGDGGPPDGLAGLADRDRVIIGGGFAERPASPAMDALYRDFDECDQGYGDTRSGAPTLQNASGQAVAKTDYLFVTPDAGASCDVPSEPVTASDHRPLVGAVRFG